MSEGPGISMLYREFADALTEVLAEKHKALAAAGGSSYAKAGLSCQVRPVAVLASGLISGLEPRLRDL